METLVLLCVTVVLICAAIIAIFITGAIIVLVISIIWEEIDSWLYFRNLEKKRRKTRR